VFGAEKELLKGLFKMETPKRGLFIAFEGIDGCGKSTQAWKLARYVSDLSKYNHIVMTREPFKDANIRKMLRETDDPYSQAKELAKMYTDDRRNHVKELIMPELLKGAHVISDRYAFSTLAYQQAQGIPIKDLLELHKGLPIPDIIFIVDVPSKVAVGRMKKDSKRDKGKEHKFEKNREFMEKLRKNYHGLANLSGHKVVVIDGTKKPEQIFEKQIKPAFDKLYNSRFSS
jgi:dTMP kinase